MKFAMARHIQITAQLGFFFFFDEQCFYSQLNCSHRQHTNHLISSAHFTIRGQKKKMGLERQQSVCAWNGDISRVYFQPRTHTHMQNRAQASLPITILHTVDRLATKLHDECARYPKKNLKKSRKTVSKPQSFQLLSIPLSCK